MRCPSVKAVVWFVGALAIVSVTLLFLARSRKPALPQMMWDAEPDVPAWAGQRKDEPFDVKQFLESRAAPPDNAAPLYFAALAELGPEMYASNLPPGHAWPWHWPSPPHVRALAVSIDGACDAEKLRSGAVPPAEVERLLAAAGPGLTWIDEAQQKPRCVFITGSMLPHIQPSRVFARLATIQLHHARTKGDFDEAEQAIRRTLRLARDVRPRGFMVTQAVSISMDGILLSGIGDFTLSQPGLKPSDCDRLLALLAEHQQQSLPLAEEGLRLEYVTMRNEIEALRDGRRSPRELAQLVGDNTPALKDRDLANLDWEMEAAACNRVFAACLAVAARPYHEILSGRLTEKPNADLRAEKAVLIRLVAPAWDALLPAAARHQAQLAGTQCLVAVRRFELAHGTPPADLETAVREANMTSVPIDPYSGQPMRYRVVDGKPRVYSLGPDQKDDGGLVPWNLAPGAPGDYLFQIGP